jgi:superfamily II helicase
MSPRSAVHAWQRRGIFDIVDDFRADPRRDVAVVTAAVGTGKIYVALGAALPFTFGSSAFARKVLFASPLVDLAKEQYENFLELGRVLHGLSSRVPETRVAYRVEHDPSTNISMAHWICATYDHVRARLIDAEAKIFPTSRRSERKWLEAYACLVIDEEHTFLTARGW